MPPKEKVAAAKRLALMAAGIFERNFCMTERSVKKKVDALHISIKRAAW